MDHLTIAYPDFNGIPLLEISGEIDLSTAPDLEHAIRHVFSKRPPIIILDLTKASYIDSTGIYTITSAYKKASTWNGTLRVIIPERSLADRVFKITGIRDLIHVHNSLEDIPDLK